MTSPDALQRPEVVAARDAFWKGLVTTLIAWANDNGLENYEPFVFLPGATTPLLDLYATALVTAVRAERSGWQQNERVKSKLAAITGGIRMELSASTLMPHLVELCEEVAASVSPPPDALRRQIEGLLKAINAACAIIETGDQRLLAGDGPAGGQPPDLSLAEWRKLYVTLDKARAGK